MARSVKARQLREGDQFVPERGTASGGDWLYVERLHESRNGVTVETDSREFPELELDWDDWVDVR